MIGASNFLILCIPPGPPSLAFIDQHREELVGKGKMFVDLSASFTRSAAACSETNLAAREPLPPLGNRPLHLARRFYSDAQRPPPPCYSHLLWLRERLNDPTASWVKAWANLMSGSIKSNRCQPVEVAGDAAAKVRAHAGAHLAFRRTVPAPPHPTLPRQWRRGCSPPPALSRSTAATPRTRQR